MKRTVFIFMMSIFGVSAAAQDSIRINLDQTLEIALSENPTIKIADKDIEKAQYAKKEQRAALLPNISASGSYQRTLEKQAMYFSGQTLKVGTDNNWSGGFNLSLPLVAPALWKTMQLSDTEIELAVESARSSRISMVYEVKSAYFAMLMAKDSHRALLQGYNNAVLNASNITDLYTQGLVSEYDKLRADVQVKSLIPNLTAAENAIYLAEMQLKVLMGIDVDEKIIFVGELADYEDDMEADVSYLLDDPSFRASTELRQIDLQTKQLEQVRAINKAANLPSLALSANYQWLSMNDNFKIGNYQWTPYSVVGVTLSIPIFEGRAKASRDRQNKINIDNIRLQRENLVRNLELGVNNSLNNIEKAINEVGSNKESIMDAERAYNISQRRYEIGSGTYIELNDSELMLTQARLAYNQSVYNYLIARTELERTLGTALDN